MKTPIQWHLLTLWLAITVATWGGWSSLTTTAWAQGERPALAPSIDDGFGSNPERAAERWDVPPDTPATTDGGATLNPLLLAKVHDNTVGLEFTDRPAYYYGLWLSQQVGAATIQQFARQFRDERQTSNPS